ncbi:hypothetical protein [Pseudidiomarina sp. CB1]|uniref:hypothetical protein n=1 Tax=Pseudidiomarina sp. CB1 TaxID=2972484 RepID=UPI002161F4E6|nr:hypothetical protein [Pseudidiomarina sp. CB1]
MDWDYHHGGFQVFGKVPHDMDLPPAIGNRAKITKEQFEFEVEIESIEAGRFVGRVLLISPGTALEALGIKRGEKVHFRANNILVLYR